MTVSTRRQLLRGRHHDCTVGGACHDGPVLKTDIVSAERLPLTNASTWFSPDDYAVSALHNNEQGAVRFALDVAATGAVTGCRIVESSGHADLDAQTCSSALLNPRFKPAVDSAGTPMASIFVRWTIWKLPHDKLGHLKPSSPLCWIGAGINMQTAIADVAVDAAGRVTGCSIKRPYGHKGRSAPAIFGRNGSDRPDHYRWQGDGRNCPYRIDHQRRRPRRQNKRRRAVVDTRWSMR